MLKILRSCEGFDWDASNSNNKFVNKYGVSRVEAEQVFFNIPLLIIRYKRYSNIGPIFLSLGRSNANHLYTIIFTIRNKNLIRIILARDMSRKESNEYEEKIKEKYQNR